MGLTVLKMSARAPKADAVCERLAGHPPIGSEAVRSNKCTVHWHDSARVPRLDDSHQRGSPPTGSPRVGRALQSRPTRESRAWHSRAFNAGTSIGVGRLSDSRRLFCRRETNSWRAPPRVPSRTEGGLNGAVKCICGRHVLMLRPMQSPPGMIQLWNLWCRRPVTSVYSGKPTP